MSYDYRFKLIVVGETGTGKTCLVSQFTQPEYSFDKRHEVTIGVDFSVKIKGIDLNNKNYTIKTQIWDTAGQEAFRSITASYYRNTAAILLVFDVANKLSFTRLGYWIKQIKKNAQHNPEIFIIGNKDDVNKREVNYDEAVQFCKNYNISYIETSAKDNAKVNSLFDFINKAILKKTLEHGDKLEGVFKDQSKQYPVVESERENCYECCTIS